jgi:hypothetical protein
MSTVDEITAAIERLSATDVARVGAWLSSSSLSALQEGRANVVRAGGKRQCFSATRLGEACDVHGRAGGEGNASRRLDSERRATFADRRGGKGNASRRLDSERRATFSESSHDSPSREHNSNSPPIQWNIFDPVAVIDLAVRCPVFRGTMQELLRVFNIFWQSGTYRSSDLPKTARALPVKLRRRTPQLRSIGIEVEFLRASTNRIVTIAMTGQNGASATRHKSLLVGARLKAYIEIKDRNARSTDQSRNTARPTQRDERMTRTPTV